MDSLLSAEFWRIRNALEKNGLGACARRIYDNSSNGIKMQKEANPVLIGLTSAFLLCNCSKFTESFVAPILETIAMYLKTSRTAPC
jgi:hypothetical protein